MTRGNGFNCAHCPEYKKGTCNGDKDCMCYECPRNLGQCLCVKYCRETESILTIEEEL
ncbi:hypothetical protein [Clostridium intestinale]|uniref:Uncharacterized protein n=1 Tax=Clostridium intestinale DSM 6191 TaxID=1121320 RepID=A0A1M6ERN4_9CLOT|nr:hypothetical protein [Clostridium intestinale]SHI87960.1 hypothetical protein SAMN02745941_04498 [Clostridium intestinale DSM 6191]